MSTVYKINGTELDPQPTSGRWLRRRQEGRDGNGRPIYEPTRQFEMQWGLLTPVLYDDLQDVFLTVSATGTVIVDLPVYTTGTYVFESYTGCYINEPETGQFFTAHYQDVRLLVTNIVTPK